MMTCSSALVPVYDEKNGQFASAHLSTNRYSIFDHGQGHRTYTYEFDLFGYEPEQITVTLTDSGHLRIRASRSPCQEFRREYYLGGTNIQCRLIRNTLDAYGCLRVDVDVEPRIEIPLPSTNHLLTFDLQGYQPKNVNVRINEKGLLKINAQHHDKTFGNHIDREYYRQYQLPKSIRPEQVRARMNEKKILTIELPPTSLKETQPWIPYNDKSSVYSPTNCGCNLM